MVDFASISSGIISITTQGVSIVAQGASMATNAARYTVDTVRQIVDDSTTLMDNVIDDMGFWREPCELRELAPPRLVRQNAVYVSREIR